LTTGKGIGIGIVEFSKRRRFFVTSASARRNNEELLTSMEELKLPREHDFKYK
jgi:hypothetical protein